MMTDEEAAREHIFWKACTHSFELSKLGALRYLLFLVASGFYIGVRIRYSLDDMRGALWYGVLVFVVELISIASLLLQGLWLCTTSTQYTPPMENSNQDRELAVLSAMEGGPTQVANAIEANYPPALGSTHEGDEDRSPTMHSASSSIPSFSALESPAAGSTHGGAQTSTSAVPATAATGAIGSKSATVAGKGGPVAEGRLPRPFSKAKAALAKADLPLTNAKGSVVPKDSVVLNPGVPKGLRHDYVIRAILPCHNVELKSVRREVGRALASLIKARLPEGSALVIYVCDDDRDFRLREYVASLSTDVDVIYVSTRRAPPGKRTNWRAELVNFALDAVFPDGKPAQPGRAHIPLTELVCVLDPEHVYSSQFFTELLYGMDSGENVGVAYAPKIAANVHYQTDIFDRQRMLYWERLQPGKESLNYLSLAHCHCLFRARALRQVDWFKTTTTEEQVEAGMHLVRYL